MYDCVEPLDCWRCFTLQEYHSKNKMIFFWKLHTFIHRVLIKFWLTVHLQAQIVIWNDVTPWKLWSGINFSRGLVFFSNTLDTMILKHLKIWNDFRLLDGKHRTSFHTNAWWYCWNIFMFLWFGQNNWGNGSWPMSAKMSIFWIMCDSTIEHCLFCS